MDSNAPNVLLTPNKSLRSKSQILTEGWGTEDIFAIGRTLDDVSYLPLPPLETWATLKLPYEAPSCPPLPSFEQILTANQTQSLRAKNGVHLICRIGDTVVKCSMDSTVLDEAENLLFLAEKRPQLNTPTVLAVWSVLDEDKYEVHCLMTEFIDGITLEGDRLAELSTEVQDRIFSKVSAQLQYLRSLLSEGYYGRVHGKGWIDPPPGIRTSTALVRTVTGPYNTYEEFISAIHLAFELQKAISNNQDFVPHYQALSVELLSIFPDWHPYEPKFTWIDPKITNLIARPVQDDSGNEDWEVFLIDWESSGWYPAWVQSMQFQHRCGASIRDYSQPFRPGHYPVLPYRKGEIIPQMLKEFDPNPDGERLATIQKHDWWFY